MEYEYITRKIIGCAYRVYNTMGFGFLESVYEKCLVIELIWRDQSRGETKGAAVDQLNPE
jgi:GxxExxY protein